VSVPFPAEGVRVTSSPRLVDRDRKSFRVIVKLPCGSPLIVHGPPWAVYDNEKNLCQLVRFDDRGPYRHVLFVRVSDGLLVGEWRETVPSLRSLPEMLQGRLKMLEHLNKAASKAAANASEFEVPEDDFAKKFPALFCFVAANVDGQGELRERCKVQLFAESGCWKACLMDPGREASIFVTLKQPGNVWDALEKALSSDRPDWRLWRKGRKK